MSTPVDIINLNLNTSTSNDTSNPLPGNPLTLQLKTPIQVGDDKIVVASLKSFFAANTFDNISAQTNTNILKIVTTWDDYTTGYPVSNAVLNTITVPDGHYSIVTLLNYLNSQSQSAVLQGSFDSSADQWYDASGNPTFVQQNFFTYSATGNPYISTNSNSMYYCYYYYGFGFNGLSNNPNIESGIVDLPANPPSLGFLTNTDASKVILNPPPPNSMYYHDYFNFPTNDPFVVSGVFLVYDDDTQNLMDILGFQRDQCTTYQGATFTNIVTSGAQILGWFPANKALSNTPVGAGYTAWIPNYTLSTITGEKAVFLGTPATLNMTIDEITMKNYGNLLPTDRNNILTTIPVSVAFGSFINFTPANPVRHMLSGPLDLSQLTIHFFDEDYDTPSFDGVAWQANIELAIYLKPSVQQEEFEARGSQNINPTPARTLEEQGARNRPNLFGRNAPSARISNTVQARNGLFGGGPMTARQDPRLPFGLAPTVPEDEQEDETVEYDPPEPTQYMFIHGGLHDRLTPASQQNNQVKRRRR